MSDAAQAGREMEGPFDMDKLWNEFHERVRCWLYRLVKNADLADELVGCVYVRVWKRQERYDPKRYTIRTWLYLNTRSVAYANLRRKRDNALSLDWIPGGCRAPGRRSCTRPRKSAPGSGTRLTNCPRWSGALSARGSTTGFPGLRRRVSLASVSGWPTTTWRVPSCCSVSCCSGNSAMGCKREVL
jgi:hypothetical protein